MPANKPMKNQWIEVDGRLIPSTLPQHWNGNDWAITGTDNPLPVANYTKKGNLWLPTSEDNPVPTQITGSIVEKLDTFENIEVSPQSSTNGTITPVGDYRALMVAARCDMRHDWSVIYQWFVLGGTTFGNSVSAGIEEEDIAIEAKNEDRKTSGQFKVRSDAGRFIIRNNTDEIHFYDVLMFGVR